MSRSRLGASWASSWRARLAGAALVATAVALGLLGLGRALPAAGLGTYPQPPAQPTPQAELGVPAEAVTLIGASPEEPGAPGGEEAWGVGQSDGEAKLVRYYVHPSETGAGGAEGTWSNGPESEGRTLPKGFEPGPEGQSDSLEGQVDPEGYGVLAGEIKGQGSSGAETLLVRKPGGAFVATSSPAVAEGGEPAPLRTGQTLLNSKRVPMMVPLHEPGGEVGALLAPVDEEGGTVDEYVLHWDGHRWTREPIKIPVASAHSFRVLALAAGSPANAWLLARLSSTYGADAVGLFRRVEEGGKWSWQPVEAQVPGGSRQLPLHVPVAGSGAPAEGEPLTVPGASDPFPAVKSQVLTVTEDGVWIDGERTDIERATPFTTVFFRPQNATSGVVESSWCKMPAGAPTTTPACMHALPEEPPSKNSRSIAWPGAEYGTRVITGLPEGVSLSLQGSAFTRVLSLGGGTQEKEELFTPGAHYGAAFSSPVEGWLGNGSGPPVHLTSSPAASRLQPWPVAFRHPLLAIAPQPGAPVGTLGSEAVAVGDEGAVARFKPKAGSSGAWVPESLYGPSERAEKSNLLAVAWPTPERVFAVGLKGEMWLWRGETGLWERDPATPINFRANLLGIAFDPQEPARGYAVGTNAIGHGGVILRYGKTWTEETSLPAAVQGAGFTGVAFAGQEALVAYSSQQPGSTTDLGGLLVNDGSGWTVDSEAAAVFGEGYPKAIAALPDGGAAVLFQRPLHGDVVFEREAQGAPWHAVPGVLPPEVAGSLSLFREGGTLRAIVSGGAIGEGASEAREAPPGVPPFEEITPGQITSANSGSVLRQTATGWSDQRHEADEAGEPSVYSFYDAPYRPEPIYATLPEAGGGEGWAVGGELGGQGEQTAAVERYATGGSRPVQEEAPVHLEPESADITTYAFGGNAQCDAPCSDRSYDRVEPQVALSSAVQLAASIGVPAFFDTGPTITKNEFAGAHAPAVPYGEEFQRTAELLGSERLSGRPLSVYDAPTGYELDEGGLGAFDAAGFPGPFGEAAPGSPQEIPAPCPCGAYALADAHVITIVLDDSHEGQVEAAQRVWLEERMQEAGGEHKPVIVVGNADLSQQLAPGQHDPDAETLFAALTGQDPDGKDPGAGGGGPPYVASAYFYDAVEENVAKQLTFRGHSLPVFGSGTLGYELPLKEAQSEFHGAKGILLGEVLWGGSRGLTSAQQHEYEAVDEAVVRVRLIPVVSELALEAEEGAVVPRSRQVLFDGLARKPRAGCRLSEGSTDCAGSEGHYIPIPSICVGASCGEAVLPEYEFTSSKPEIGGFVEVNTASNAARSVLQNANHEPVKAGHENPLTHEQLGSRSGLFCAYNKGETTVGIRAGGLSYSLNVQVQAGSVRQPCGTVPLRNVSAAGANASAPLPPPAPAPAPASSPPASAPPVVPVPPPPPPPALPAPVPPVRPPAPVPSAPFFVQPAFALPVPAFVPVPPPAPAEPTPPTGTSAVTSPVEAAQKEEEEEEATESVSNQALAYHAPEHEPSPVYALGIVLLAAFAGASIRGRPRRGGRGVRIAPATLNGSRAQRRISADERRRRW